MFPINKLFRNKVVNNASWLIGCKVAKAVLSFLVTMFTARYLGPTNYGVINYAASIVVFVVPIAQLGLKGIQVHEIVSRKDMDGQVLGTSILLSLVSSVACIIGIGIFVYFVNANERETLIVCLLYGSMLFFQTGELIQYWFQARYLAKYSALVSLGAYFLVSGYKIFLLATGKSVYWFAVSNALDYLIISVALVILYYANNGSKLTFSFRLARELLQKSKYYIIPGLMISVFSETDRIMIKTMIGNEETGFYSAAILCASLGNFVFLALVDAIRPSIFECKKINEEKYLERLSMLYGIIMYCSFFLCVAEAIFANLIIRVAYGEDYAPAIGTLRIVVWFSIFSFVGTVNGIWLLAEMKHRFLTIINIAGAFANVVLNMFLIPKWGIQGAAVATLFTQIFSNVIMIGIIPKTRPMLHLMVRGLNPRMIIRAGRDFVSDK